MITQENYEKYVELLKKYSHAYYNGTPLVPDIEYDRIFNLVKEYETKSKITNLDSVTNTVGSVTKDNRIKHLTNMYSMDNIFDIEELEDWYNKKTNGDEITFIVMPKFDGCSCNLRYENGKLVEALTRGDGTRGESMLHNVKYINGIPKNISYKDTIEIRGEIVIYKDDFNKLNNERIKNSEVPFSNPRNLASSSVRVKNIDISNRGLNFIPWGVGYNTLDIPYYNGILKFLEQQGFSLTPTNDMFTIKELDSLIDKITLLEGLRNTYRYTIDGAVIRVNGIRLSEAMGYTNRAPRFAIAYKFKPEECITKLRDVIWQVGRTGVVTPVGILDTVKVGDVNVSNVTLHNMSYIKNLDLRIGDSISIIRSGDVIPKLSLVLRDRRNGSEKEINSPRVCPDCRTKLITEGAYKVCPNNECPSQLVNKVIHFASKKAMNIDGLGDIVTKELFDSKLVTTPKDLYNLNLEELSQLPSMGPKRAINLLNNIYNSKGIDLSRFIYSLGINNIGYVASYELSKLGLDWYKRSLEELSNTCRLNTTIVSKIKELESYIEELQNLVQPTYTPVSKLLPMNIVITGTLSSPRNQLMELLKKYNVIVSSSVSKNTEVVVAGSNPTQHKIDKANSLEIKVINENELMKLIDDRKEI